MRKNIRLKLLFVALAVTFIQGCSDSLGQSEVSGLTVSIEQGRQDISNALGDEEFSGAVTKTALTGDDYICWSEGDKIFVNGTATANTLTVVPFGNEATTAALNGTTPEPAASGRKYCGYYPASTTYWTVSGTAKQVKLPAAPAYDATSPLGNVPMYAESDDKHLTFKPLFGILEFTITGERTVKTLKITANTNIAGTFNLTADGGVTLATGGATAVTMSFGTSGVKAGKSGLKVYIPVPAASYASFKVELTTVESSTVGGEDFNKTISGTFKIARGELFTNAFSSEPMAVQLWAGGPYWATANLGTTTSTGMGDFYMWGSVDKCYTAISTTSFTFITNKADLPAAEQSRHPAWDGSKKYGSPNAPWEVSDYRFSKYVSYAKASSRGAGGTFYDDKTVLDEEDDVASVQWGGAWRLPTKADFDDLLSRTTVTEVTESSVKCFKYASKTDATKYILLPKRGYCGGSTRGQNNSNGYYWSSSLDENEPAYAWNLILNPGECHTQNRDRWFGWTIRCVRD